MKVVPLTLRKKIGLELWRQHERMTAREHPLRQLFWECTLRCNLHCRHCGSDCRVQAATQDMPLSDFLRVLDSIRAKTDPSQVFVILSGGEPLMRTDIVECGQAITGRGFPWGMVSNGFALTAERFHQLLRAGMRSITISLDGLAEEHNWMRGHRESFQCVDQAISLLVRTPSLSADIVTCVNRRNYHQLPALKEYLISKGVNDWRLFTVFPVGRAANDPELRLSNEQFVQMMEFAKRVAFGLIMAARVFLATTKVTFATISSAVRQASPSVLYWQMAAYRLVPAYVPTIIKATSTTMTSCKCGNSISYPIATTNGCVPTTAPNAGTSASVRVTACICATTTVDSCFVTSND